METVLQEIVEAADAWFATGRTRRAGVEYDRFQLSLMVGRDALLTQRREELANLEQMAFDIEPPALDVEPETGPGRSEENGEDEEG